MGSPIPDASLTESAVQVCVRGHFLIGALCSQESISGPEEAVHQLSTEASLVGVKRVHGHGGRFEERHLQHGLHLWYTAKTSGLTSSALKILQSHTSLVSTAAVVPAARLAAVPDDPRYSEQRHHQALEMESAWAITGGAANVVVAIIDTGVDMNHPDLRRSAYIAHSRSRKCT
eukprot:6190094-Pleurochrysis_carterae.AAC.3